MMVRLPEWENGVFLDTTLTHLASLPQRRSGDDKLVSSGRVIRRVRSTG